MTQRSVPHDPPPADDELLTIREVAAIVRAPNRHLALLAPPRHRPPQLPPRPTSRLPSR